MPLDPMIANPATIKLADPMEQYGSFLKNAYLQDEIDKAKQTRDDESKYNAIMAANVKPDGSYDRGGLKYAFAQGGQGKQIPKLDEHFAKLDKAASDVTSAKALALKNTAQAGDFDASALKKTLENTAKDLQGTPTDPGPGLHYFIDKLQLHYGNPLIRKSIIDSGGDPLASFKQDSDAATLAAQNPATWREHLAAHSTDLARALEQVNTHMTNSDGQQFIVQQGKFGGPASVVDGSTFAHNPKVPQITVTQNNERKATGAFMGAAGKGLGENYVALSNLAKSVPAAITQLDRMIDIVKSDKVYMGAGSDLKLEGLRIAKGGGQKLSPEDEEILNNTQELDKYLEGNVLQQTAALNKAGLGARTSVMEIKMMKDASARRHMEPGAALTILLNQRKDLQDAIPRFNSANQDVLQQPDLEPGMRAVASHRLNEIPDHPAQIEREYKPDLKGVNGKPINAKQYVDIRMNPQHAAEFDAYFGAGSAAKLLHQQPGGGGAPTGGTPFTVGQ